MTTIAFEWWIAW